MKTITLDDYINKSPFACAMYRHEVKQVMRELCNDIINLCADEAEDIINNLKYKKL